MRDWKLVETLPIHFLYPSRLSLSRMRAMVQGGEPVDLFFFFFWINGLGLMYFVQLA
jgi:hypothetical protein